MYDYIVQGSLESRFEAFLPVYSATFEEGRGPEDLGGLRKTPLTLALEIIPKSILAEILSLPQVQPLLEFLEECFSPVSSSANLLH